MYASGRDFSWSVTAWQQGCGSTALDAIAFLKEKGLAMQGYAKLYTLRLYTTVEI